MDYHGIILDSEFNDPNFVNKFKVLNKRPSRLDPWTLCGIVVAESEIERVIKDIQGNLKEDKTYYVHFYRENELIIVFKNRIFKLSTNPETWSEAIGFGKSLSIPERQMNFAPVRFEDEEIYFRDNPTG